MKIYKISNFNNEVLKLFLDKFRPSGLKGLAAEAIKSESFRDFETNFIGEIKHGTYWHITDNPNFTIDSDKGPRDMSSMSNGGITKGTLMVTTHLENWIGEYPDRQYVAEIDLSQVDSKDYYQVNRSFGNEFFIKNPSLARVVQVIPLKNALRLDKRRNSILPNSQQSLEEFYNDVQKRWVEFKFKSEL